MNPKLITPVNPGILLRGSQVENLFALYFIFRLFLGLLKGYLYKLYSFICSEILAEDFSKGKFQGTKSYIPEITCYKRG